jgi:chromosome segregation ATPase
MTTQSDDTQAASVISAVQRELNRFSDQVSTEVQRLRAEMAADRGARTELEEQIRALAPAIERAQAANAGFQNDIQRALEERLNEFATLNKRRHEEMDARIGRVVDEANIGLSAAVESAARPIVKQVEHRQELLERELGTLDKNLRKFDDQAARMVTHFNDVTRATETKMNEVSAQVAGDIDQRLSGLSIRVDEISAQAARQQSEVSNIVGNRVDAAEDRINERMLASETRVNETVGQRVADIDAYVGRVSAGLDEAVVMLSDRIAAMDRNFEAVDRSVADLNGRLAAVDIDSIDEMKEKVASAMGSAELLRIEMERFQKTIADAMDKTNLRMVELETTIQDQTLDVDTSIQLERLEEVERAIIALDPAQFVRRNEMNGAAHATAQVGAPLGAPMASPNGSNGFAAAPLSPPVNGTH